jgi:hypothetical protein
VASLNLSVIIMRNVARHRRLGLSAISVGAMIATCSPVAQAAAPLVTDDAAVVEAKSCQLESWIEFAHGARAYWAVPACNFTGNLELALGGAGVNPDGTPSSHRVTVQAKAVFVQGGNGLWSVGAVGGVIRDTGPVESDASSRSYYAKALLSLYPDDALEVDLNLGASNDFGAGTTVTAGVALQYEVLPRATLLAEIFRDERGPGKFQVGARYALDAAPIEAYVSYGNRLGSASGDTWWVIAGIRVYTKPFLP